MPVPVNHAGPRCLSRVIPAPVSKKDPVEITIRPAKPEDISRLSELLSELFTLESDFSPDIEKQVKGLSMLITEPLGAALVLVAVFAGTIVGMATVQTLVSTAEGGRVGLVEDVIVGTRFRCRNVGTLLLDRLIAWSREKRLTRLQLFADQGNHQALNFYFSRSWTATRLICMRKML
jgi:GNAT superfamily N-acetyltransferase